MENSASHVDEVAMQYGGWITFPFTIATMAGLLLAARGWSSNLIVFLINEFNMKSIAAAKVFNVVNGLTTISPIVGGIIADSYLGSAIDALKPLACGDGSNICTSPSTNQYGFLYVALALASIGIAAPHSSSMWRTTSVGHGVLVYPRLVTYLAWQFFSLANISIAMLRNKEAALSST
ncbi:hypothetical protein RND71_021003 [Anisodus tanguticus]|uniref:Uncharacterized protein n=1 Tax=Anisodus tanguticus TaxID=243964 RepID=A0AAE1RWZ3_9SOLA|nr:hypothetical protein RND71_021003 [Anisodus tanguticus]